MTTQLQRRQANKWGKENDEALLKAVKIYGTKKWSSVSTIVPGKNTKQCRERWQQLNPPSSTSLHEKKSGSKVIQTKLTTTAPLKLSSKSHNSVTIDTFSPITPPVDDQDLIKLHGDNVKTQQGNVSKPQQQVYRSTLFHPSATGKPSKTPCKRSIEGDRSDCKKFKFEDIDFYVEGLSGAEIRPRSNVNWTSVFFGSNEKTSFEYHSVLDRSASPFTDECGKKFCYTLRDESFLYRNGPYNQGASSELKLDNLPSRAASSPRFGQYDCKLTVTSGPYLTPSKSKTVDPEAYQSIGFVTQDNVVTFPENMFASLWSNPEQKARHRTILHNLLITDAIGAKFGIVC